MCKRQKEMLIRIKNKPFKKRKKWEYDLVGAGSVTMARRTRSSGQHARLQPKLY